MTPKQEAALRQAREALVVLDQVVLGTRRAEETIAAIDEALAKQPARQQEPDGRVISANCEYATVQWLHQTSNIGGGDPKNSRSWPIGGEDVYLSPPASKPWVGLTDEEELKLAQDSVGKSRHWLVAQVGDKLREKNA